MASPENKSFWNKFFNEDRIRGGVWGGAIVAAALIIGGSYVPGWQLDSTAAKAVLDGQESILVSTLAPVCAERFRAQDDLPVQVAALKETKSWDRDNYLVDNDWVISSGMGNSVDQAIGVACANLLNDLVE